ncbi:hypothetical protein AX16_003701 [Volvariella volvacea WC 439]|nr:hypothetical protein AX16_003701 [Volvariella volvacea WC 439]
MDIQEHAVSHAHSVLDGYTAVEWPDLTAHRFPAGDTTTLQQAIDRDIHIDSSTLSALLLVVIARVLGPYVGATDVLLALLDSSEETPTFVRPRWDENISWDQAIRVTHQNLQQNKGRLTYSSIRRILDINEKISPCIASCSLSGDEITKPQCPLHFRFDETLGMLSLTTTTAHAHPSVSEQILAQAVSLFQHASSRPESLMHKLPALPPHLISTFARVGPDRLNESYPGIPVVTLAFEFLENRAATRPDAVAVRWHPELSIDEDTQSVYESITYHELNSRANKFARWLLHMGLRTEQRVAVSMARDPHFHIAMMGIMKAGGCYVPIDPDLPNERKSYIAQDSNALFVLTNSNDPSSSLFGSATVYIDKLDELEEQDGNNLPPGTVAPENLAYLLYTSGTTGQPKGCLLTHHGLSQAIIALSSAAAQVRMDDLFCGRYLAFASIAFDVHLAETFVSIVLGMPLFSAQRSQLLENLPHYIKTLAITHVGIVPSLIEATMGAAQSNDTTNMDLRYIASGGEKISDSILDKWADHPQVTLANFYGPSEVTIGCCARVMDSATPKANIGRPFANVSACVVDRDMNILLRGGVGELVVSGPLVGRGYHGRPDLTEKVFCRWPNPEDWSYRTGDLVRMMPDNTIEILGRIDTQIKLRGVRIESEGISAIVRKAVSSSPTEFLDAVTVLAKHPQIGTEQLVSFVTWDSTVSISTRKSSQPYIVNPPSGLLETIKRICEAEIASYMRPSHILPISWLPLSSNGKSDDKVLVKFFNGLDMTVLATILSYGHGESSNNRAPTKHEQDVFSVLKRHVSIPVTVLHPQTNIYECGMDSLTITQFAADLKTTFGVQVTVTALMKNPTVSGIAELLNASTKTAASNSDTISEFVSRQLPEVLGMFKDVPVEHLLPPFTVQEGVLFRSSSDELLYVQHLVLRTKQGVSLEKIRGAWETVVQNTPALRTVFNFGRALTQVVLAPNSVPLPWQEEHAPPDQVTPEWFMSYRADIVSKDINSKLSESPPWRLSAFTSSVDATIVLSIHHALYDGISLPILASEVERAYMMEEPRPQPSPVEILRHVYNGGLENGEQFWKAYFKDFQWLGDVFVESGRGGTRRARVEFIAPLSRVKALASSQQVTVQALLTSAFAEYAMVNIYKRADIAFGVIRSGRLVPVEHIDNALLPMIAVLPFRVNFRDSSDALTMIQRDISAMVEHEHTPLGRIQSWIRPGRSIFDLMFSVSIKSKIQTRIWDIVESEPPAADFPLAAEAVLDPESDSLCIQAAWIQGCFEDASIRDFLINFEGRVLDIGKEGKLDLGDLDRSTDQITSPILTQPNEPDQLHISSPTAYPVALANDLRAAISNFLLVDSRLFTDATSFISMGLDSIKSVGLAKQLKKAGYQLSAVDLMRYHTIPLLAAHISTRTQLTDDLQAPAGEELILRRKLDQIQQNIDLASLKFTPDDEVTIYPTTSLQTGMLTHTVNSRGTLYVHGFPIRMSTGINYERLKDAWYQTVEMLSILRTTFHFLHSLGAWVQIVHSEASLKWSEASFQSMEDFNAKLRAFLTSVQSLDEEIFRTPPIWLRLFKPDSIDLPPRLVVVMHHALYDGLSVRKLVDLTFTVYRGASPYPSTQFADLVKHFLYQEEKGTSFWVGYLKGYQPRLLPTKSDTKVSTLSHSISKEILLDSSHVNNMLKAASVTAQCLGQAALAYTLASLTKSIDIVFGHTVSGRSLPNAEDVIGPVLNTIPCRIQLRRELSNLELLREIHQHNVSALPWHHAALRSIQRELGVSRLWDCLFLFQPSIEVEEEKESLWGWDDVEDGAPEVQYPINIELHQRENGFLVQIACRSDHLDLEELESFVRRFEEVLRVMLSSAEGVPSQFLDISSFESLTPVDTLPSASSPLPIPEHRASVIRSILSSATNIQTDKITLNAPLAALGVDSITAIQIVAKCRNAKLKILASEVVRCSTVADLILAVKETGESNKSLASRATLVLSEPERANILSQFGEAADQIESVFPLSSGMKWLIGAWERSERTRFQHAFAYKLGAGVDIKRLQNAWTALVKQHAILRSTFVSAGQVREPRLVVLRSSGVEFWLQEEQESVTADLVKEKLIALVRSPYSYKIPPTKALLLSSLDQSYLLIRLHHFQYDAWSLQLIVQDLVNLYHGKPPIALNKLGTLLAAAHDGTAVQEQQRYWKSAFPSSRTPPLYPALSESGPTLARTIYTNKRAINQAALFEKRAHDLQLSLQAVLLAAWSKIQAEQSSSDDIVFGIWHSGRAADIDDIAKLAVPCINILPVYVPASGSRDVIALATQIQANLRDRSAVVEYSDLERVHEWSGAGKQPLCNVFINIVKVAPDISSDKANNIFELLDMPYIVPTDPPKLLEDSLEQRRSAISELIQDDILVDMAVASDEDSILISIDSAAHFLNADQAADLADRWARVVQEALIIPSA